MTLQFDPQLGILLPRFETRTGSKKKRYIEAFFEASCESASIVVSICDGVLNKPMLNRTVPCWISVPRVR